MKHRVTITFRGVELEVDVLSYQADPDTNSAEIIWDIVGLTDEGLEMLNITQTENEDIDGYLIQVMEDRYANDIDSYGV